MAPGPGTREAASRLCFPALRSAPRARGGGGGDFAKCKPGSPRPVRAPRPALSPQVFKFSYNKLRVLTAHTLQGLRSLLRLHVDHNEIEFVHPHAFRGLAALRLLHLEGNRLHQLHPATFCTFSLLDHFRLSTVRHLYLADNRLQSLPAGTLESMPLLENLYLHGNPWACDCRMRWLLEGRGRAAGKRGRGRRVSPPRAPPPRPRLACRGRPARSVLGGGRTSHPRGGKGGSRSPSAATRGAHTPAHHATRPRPSAACRAASRRH